MPNMIKTMVLLIYMKIQERTSTSTSMVKGRGFRVLPLYTIVWRVHRRYVVLFEITVQA